MTTSALLAFLTCLGAATVGGVFFAFSSFVMKALALLPAAQGIVAMQRINVVVLNPMFLGAFLGTTLSAAAAAIWAILDWLPLRSPLLIAGGLLYVCGTFGVTMMFNVPRNERLARLDPEHGPAQSYWSNYVNEWVFWNHVRTAAALLCAACCAGGLAA